jgi:hypothetical protein
MLVTIQAMCDRIRRRSVRIARPAPKGNISKRLKLLDEMQQKLDSLLKQHPSWKSDTLVRVFKAELREARDLYATRRYRAARKSRGHAAATLICIERNMNAARLKQRIVVN